MAESLKNDDNSIRSYILNDVLEKVPIDKSYENLCKVIGKDAIAFYDFQYWYYRFLSGNQDLDFDRSSEPEPLQFSDLPVDAVGLIANKLEVMEKLMLRRVSKPLREFIEKQVIDCASIGVSFGDDLIHVSYGNKEILYAKNDVAVKLYEKEYGVRGALTLYEGDAEVCDDLACVLKNPKLQLDFFRFSFLGEDYEGGVLSTFFTKFEYALKSLKHQIYVKKLCLPPEHPVDVLAILPYLKSGYLETIAIDCKRVDDDWDEGENLRKVGQIMQLDQWKQAKKLSLSNSMDLFPGQVLFQFERYKIDQHTLEKFGLDRIKMMFAASPVFEYCHLSVREPCYEGDLNFIGVPGPPAKGYRSVRHYTIPNTDNLLVFKENEYGDIVIEKKTRDAQ